MHADRALRTCAPHAELIDDTGVLRGRCAFAQFRPRTGRYLRSPHGMHAQSNAERHISAVWKSLRDVRRIEPGVGGDANARPDPILCARGTPGAPARRRGERMACSRAKRCTQLET